MDNLHNKAQEVQHEVQQKVQVARRPWYSVLLQTRFLLGFYLLLLVFFGALTLLVYVHPLLPIDVVITREFQENRSPWLGAFMLAISYPGNASWLFVGLILLTFVVFWLVRLRLEAVVLVGICLNEALLNLLVKVLVARPRPSQPLVTVLQYASGKSFPSGHVMSYVAFWGTLFTFSFILFHGKHWWRIVLLIVSGLFVILVGPSRIYLGDHWASDVLGAYLLGGLWLWACFWLYIKLKARHVLASPASLPETKNGSRNREEHEPGA